MKKVIDGLERVLPWLVLFLMYSEVRNIPVLSLLSVFLFIISYFKLGMETKSIALILFVAPILVILFKILGFSITVYPFSLGLGIYLARAYWRDILNGSHIVMSYLGVLVILILWFLYGPQHAYAQTKLIMSIVIGIGSIFAWTLLVDINSDEARKLARLLLAICLIYMSIALEFFRFPYPSDLFDLDVFRVGFYDYIKVSDDLPFTYHSMGIPILFACALLFGTQGFLKGKAKLDDLLLLFLCLYLVLLSQARQAILGVFLILILKVWISTRLSFLSKISLVFVVIGALILTLIGVETTAFSEATFGNSLAVNRNYDRAFDLINEYPILGSGLGGYSTTGLRDYPHNILWELLSEFGLLGTFLVGLFSARQIIIHPKRALYYVNQYGQILLLIVAAFGVRALSSSDLTENIVWLVALIVYSDAIRREGVLKDKLLFSRDRYVK